MQEKIKDDTISRQAAIEALLEKGQSSRRYKIGEIWELNFDEIREVLNNLSPAEPEIIRCKDCKWWKQKFSSGYYEPIGVCSILTRFPLGNSFCDRAVRKEK
jgi:hypothetical protein